MFRTIGSRFSGTAVSPHKNIHADAIMDRIVRNAYRFDLKGPSRRPTIVHQAADAVNDKAGTNEYSKE